MLRSALVIAALTATATAASALTPAEQRGQTFAMANCAMCHSVQPFGDSPLAPAPPFRTISQIRDIDKLREPLHVGTVSENPSMPHFLLDAAQISDLIAYLHALNPSTAAAPKP